MRVEVKGATDVTYLLKNGQVVLEREGRFVVSQEHLLLRDSVIAGVGSSSVPEAGELPEVVDASQMLILPGLINSHNHPQASLQRGMLRPRRETFIGARALRSESPGRY
jgi:cytosine/adenosine deaminase-related metal-dependent hydrolase